MGIMTAYHEQTSPEISCQAFGSLELKVLGKFELIACSKRIHCGRGCQRLLILLATRGGHLNRGYAAGLLWPDVTTDRANGNLRSVLWRLNQWCEVVVETTFSDLRLADHVVTDVQCVRDTARRFLDHSAQLSEEQLRRALECNLYDDICPLRGDEEWLAEEIEQHRQMRIHALEALADQLIDVGWFGAAVGAALAVLRVDPYRESAYALLIQAYLAEGNAMDARRAYRRYCTLLRQELGVEPSPWFMRVMASHPSRQPR
jgi:DNA-binding SARP family transcriptional activator